MIVIQIGIAGDRPCGWAYQPQRDDDEPGKVIRGSVQATQNQTILYVANRILEKLSDAKPEHCGVLDVGGANVVMLASQSYLLNRINGRDNGKANSDLWDTLFETIRKRSEEGFVIRWQHIPATENPMREPASQAASECPPISLTTAPTARLPW
jgi:hypothetical protein